MGEYDIDMKLPEPKFRRTGVVCTIGPVTQSVESLEKLMRAGMDVVRMNFSHGTHEYHAKTVANARQAAKNVGKIMALALDTKGPEIRTGTFVQDGDIMMNIGDKVTITNDVALKAKGTKEKFFIDYSNLPKTVKPGGIIYIDDGLLSLKVDSTDGSREVKCTVVNTAPISNYKGVNLPSMEVDLPALSEKDLQDLAFGLEQGLDMVFASFIRKPADVFMIRKALGDKGKHVKIIAKIENHEGVKKFKSILEVVDGVMVARGDLGIEIPPEQVFVAQKMMISQCTMAGKPCIVATQMLESMVKNPRPTRAEVSDVANAVMDGADCVMLSGETAKGKYPTEAVLIMAKICQQAEELGMNMDMFEQIKRAQPTPLATAETVSCSAVLAAYEQNCSLIIVLTNSGDTGRLVCKYRPSCPVLCVVGSSHAHTARQMALTRGALACVYDDSKMKYDGPKGKPSADERLAFGLNYAKSQGLVQKNANVVCVYSDIKGVGYPNLMKIVPVA